MARYTPPPWLPHLWWSFALLGLVLFLSGLLAHLRLGNAEHSGVLLVPRLPTSLYIVMAAVVLLSIGLTVLVSMTQRRRKTEQHIQKQQEAEKTPWQAAASLLSGLLVCGLLLWWVVRYGAQMQELLARLRAEAGLIQELLEGAQAVVRQVHSPTTGYALFAVVMVVYGGLAILAGWVLFESFSGWRPRPQEPPESPQQRQVRRAVQAGLQELQEHHDPRAAIIACYARLEHLLEDYGVPVAQHLTPQEYMKAALQGLELPLDALAALVELFELARYSLHPLEENDRRMAIHHLEHLQHSLTGTPAYGYQR